MVDDVAPTTGIAPDAVLRAVVDSAVDAIILIDGDGTVLAFKPGAERTFG